MHDLIMTVIENILIIVVTLAAGYAVANLRNGFCRGYAEMKQR